MTLATLTAVPVLVAIAADDLRHHRVRNAHLLVLAALVAVAVAVVAITDGPGVVVRALLGSVLAGAPYFVSALVQPHGMGGGDVKLAALIDALLGSASPWLSMAAAASALVLPFVAAVVRQRRHVALAPALVVAALGCVGAHTAIG
jgi:leader peptidase (prepilin peptidase) / N-methyltransferase